VKLLRQGKRGWGDNSSQYSREFRHVGGSRGVDKEGRVRIVLQGIRKTLGHHRKQEGGAPVNTGQTYGRRRFNNRISLLGS